MMRDEILNPDEVAAASLVYQTLVKLTERHDKLCPCQLCDARFWANVTPDCDGSYRITDVVPKGGPLDGVVAAQRRKRSGSR